MIIHFQPPVAELPVSSLMSSLEGCVSFLHGTCNGRQFTILAEDNVPEMIEVHKVVKRRLHVVTDADLRIERIRREQPSYGLVFTFIPRALQVAK